MLNGDAHQILEVEELRIRPVAFSFQRLNRAKYTITKEPHKMGILVN
jgi:hypothetical protein